MRYVFIGVAWLAAGVIAASTLSPIGYRPHLAGLGPDIERLGAFFVVTLAFLLAYPHRPRRVVALMALAAIGLELAQTLVSGRHGMPADAVVKLCGVALAAATAWASRFVARRGSAG